MAINVIVKAASAGVHGFDANTKLKPKTAGGLQAAGFKFAIRYLSRGDQLKSGDLDAQEVEVILKAGLALMAVQHVESEPWEPTLAKGGDYGANMVKHAIAAGLPLGINLWLDLEGVSHAVPAEVIIGYCNAWFDKVSAGGYVPGIYVGANSNLSGDQLYWRLRTKHYWKSGSSVPDIPERGYCMVQHIVPGDSVAGVGIDRDVTKVDNLGNTPVWVEAAGADDHDHVPEFVPGVVALTTVVPIAAGSFPVDVQLGGNVPGLYNYRSDDRRFGIRQAIEALQEVGRIWALRRPAPRIGIGEISKQGGGQISGHVSHRLGVDADIRPMRDDAKEKPVQWTEDHYSAELTQELVDLFHVNGILAVKLIFFNDPTIVGRQPWPNHDDHLHVRFHFPGEADAFPALRSGSRGAAVRELQRRLNFWKRDNAGAYPDLVIDGGFGDKTRTAVVAVQQASGLPQTGTAAVATWQTLPKA